MRTAAIRHCLSCKGGETGPTVCFRLKIELTYLQSVRQIMNGAMALAPAEGESLPPDSASCSTGLKGAMSKNKNKDKALNKTDNEEEKSKTLKNIPPLLNNAEKELSRKRKNNMIENSLSKIHKEDIPKKQINKEVKIDKSEIYNKTEKKIKGNMLKRSSCQESFEDMLLDMDEQLKEFCVKKQKNKDKKYKKRGKIVSNKPQDQKENGFNSKPDNELEASRVHKDVTEKLTSKPTLETEDQHLEELNLNVQSELQNSEDNAGIQESKLKKEPDHADDPSTKLVENQDMKEDSFPVESTKKRIHCDINSEQKGNKSKRLKAEEAEEDEIPQMSYKAYGKRPVKQTKNVKNNIMSKEKKELKKDGKNKKQLKEKEEKKKDTEKWKW
ncbi:DNA ligase 1-like [Mobula hypostoma]|uniref:DNA ligase 1-like n=1 Tax=Mobula hypostoma TaxID=723540 RepID=UPI002FC32927